MAVLQTPELAYCRGQVRPWNEAVIHVSSEALIRGLNVFEGLKAYWQPDGSMGIVALQRHFDRLQRSATLLHFPFSMNYAQFEDAVHSLVEPLCAPGKNIWIRATLFMVEGHWGEDQQADLVLTAYLTALEAPEPIKVGISTWKRATDAMLPARIKTSSNYQVARLARIEGRPRGFEDMILLNQYDRVAEAGGSCVLMARDGVVATPPASEGTLESITVDIAEAMARDMGIPFQRRPIERTELYIADEIALLGTLAEFTPVDSVDNFACSGRTSMLAALALRYREAVSGIDPHPSTALSSRHYANRQREHQIRGDDGDSVKGVVPALPDTAPGSRTTLLPA